MNAMAKNSNAAIDTALTVAKIYMECMNRVMQLNLGALQTALSDSASSSNEPGNLSNAIEGASSKTQSYFHSLHQIAAETQDELSGLTLGKQNYPNMIEFANTWSKAIASCSGGQLKDLTGFFTSQASHKKENGSSDSSEA